MKKILALIFATALGLALLTSCVDTPAETTAETTTAATTTEMTTEAETTAASTTEITTETTPAVTTTVPTETTTQTISAATESTTETTLETLPDMFEELMAFMDPTRGYFYGKSDIRKYNDADYEQLVGVHYRVIGYDESYVGTWCTRWNIEIIEVYGEERYNIEMEDYPYLCQMYIKGKPETHLYGRPIPEVGKEYLRYISKKDLLDGSWGVGLYLAVKEENGEKYLYGYGIDMSVFEGAIAIVDEEENQIYKVGTHDRVITYLNSIGQALPTFDYKCEVHNFLYGLGILEE